jgi:hypothetical protein
MLKVLTSVVLILVLAGSLVAGTPLGSHEHHCGMSGMDGMDCCQKAGMATDAPDVQAARLCCAINCPQPGPVQNGQVKPQTAPLAVVAEHPSAAQSPFTGFKPQARPQPARDHLSNSPPSYIRHLSLLI